MTRRPLLLSGGGDNDVHLWSCLHLPFRFVCFALENVRMPRGVLAGCGFIRRPSYNSRSADGDRVTELPTRLCVRADEAINRCPRRHIKGEDAARRRHSRGSFAPRSDRYSAAANRDGGSKESVGYRGRAGKALLQASRLEAKDVSVAALREARGRFVGCTYQKRGAS